MSRKPSNGYTRDSAYTRVVRNAETKRDTVTAGDASMPVLYVNSSTCGIGVLGAIDYLKKHYQMAIRLLPEWKFKKA